MRRWLKVLACAAVVVALAWWPVRRLLILRFGISEVSTFEKLIAQRLGLAAGPDEGEPGEGTVSPPGEAPPQIQLDPSIVPFREIGSRLGERAVSTRLLPLAGAAAFDADGDGRLDIYLAHEGRPLARPTTPDGLLRMDERVPAKPCVLFLNRGNDPAGDPIFTSVQELVAAGNGQREREELLIENKYRPRESAAEEETGPGRIAWGAVAADFDGDGRLDLYVLNGHYGLLIQTHQLGMRVYPARRNLGRGERRDPLVIRQPSFLWGPLTDGLTDFVDLGPEPEPEGRNSLYLNLGDRDGDGIPEWRDATEEAGVGGRHASTSAAVADFDRDGDLDLYVANFLDPDFWGFGDTRFAGQRNQLYVNLLAETGELRFRDAALELGVAGLHREEGLEASLWVPSEGRSVPTAEQVVDGRPVGEVADHSWAAAFVDLDDDPFPDLVVANDIGNRLRVYKSVGGASFRRRPEFDAPEWDGCWMGMSSGDLDGDLRDDLFVTNCGSQAMSVANTALLIEDAGETNVQALSILGYPLGKSTLHHEILSPGPDGTLRPRATEVELVHSAVIPPDMTRESNFAPEHRELFAAKRFAGSLTGIEFAFNAPMLDVDNDGDLDLYLAGALLRGNDGFIGDWSGSPGRLLVNESRDGRIAFHDRTLEYRLLDVAGMDYEHNPPRRPAPGTSWHKRDFVAVTDTDAYEGMGLDASKSVIRDIFRLHESANAILAADFNGDGGEDLLVTHSGGYNSVSPAARNLKVEIAGRALAVPAPNKVMKPPTAFEGGPTFLYLNGGPPRGREGRWIKLRLSDASGHNRFGVGARVVANGRLLRWVRATSGGAFGAAFEDLHVGLGVEPLSRLEIRWPAGDPAPQVLTLEPPKSGETLCIDRREGVVPCA